jgi:hypothetical protein
LECKPSCPAESTSVQVVLGWLGDAGRNRRSADWGRSEICTGFIGGEKSSRTVKDR